MASRDSWGSGATKRIEGWRHPRKGMTRMTGQVIGVSGWMFEGAMGGFG